MKKSILSSACFLAALGAAGSVAAQAENGEKELSLEEIIVTGSFQKALSNALNEKRNADQILEAVSAEDIGKLPDISIAEAIGRLPGVVANRDRGNATEISIRGLGPNLSNTLLNGREVATGEASRNIRYETYPAELLNGAYLFKSPKASLLEGGVGGTVDLQTIKPLDLGERRVVVNARASHFELASDIADADTSGYTGSISYVDQFLEDTLGVVLAYSRREQPIASARTNIFSVTGRNAFANANTAAFDAAGIDRVPFGYEALIRGGDDDRNGFVAATQWRPNENLEINVDYFYSGIDFVENQRGFRAEGAANEFGNLFTDVEGAGGFLVGGTVAPTADFGARFRNVNERFTLFDDSHAGGINLAWNDGAHTVVADIGYSKNDREQGFVTVQTEVHDVSGVPAIIFDGSLNGSFASDADGRGVFDFNFDLSDPTINLPAFVQAVDFETTEDEVLSLKLDYEYGFDDGFFNDVSFGVRVTDREKSFVEASDFPFIATADRESLSAELLGQPLTGAGSITFPATLTFDTDAVIAQVFGGIDPQQSQFNTTASWVVEEQIFSTYVEAGFEGSLARLPYSGNVGVRVVETETVSSSSFLQQGQETNFAVVVTPFEVENDYTYVLPSLNLSFFPSDNHIVRFGLSSAIARAPLDDLNAGIQESNYGEPSAFGGNPLLEPFETDQLDLTYEWYFSEGAALTTSAFYKDIDTFIVRLTRTDTTLPSGGIGSVTQPINGEGGTIKGLEFSYTQPLTFLPAPLNGLGISANYTLVDSDIEVSPAFVEGVFPLPGLAENTFNAQLWYFKRGFEARVGYRYRDAYATELGDVPNQVITNDSEVLVDFQMSYEFAEDSGMNGLKLMFQANNLTDEPFKTFLEDESARSRFEEFGRRYWLGFSYEF